MDRRARAAPEAVGRIEAWTGWGRRLLGDREWQQAVEMSAARVGETWWFGVLAPD